MKGTYKVYDSEQREWKELPLFFKGNSAKLKIENNHLYASYDGEKTWEDVGEISIDIYETYVDENFVPRSVEDYDNANTNIDINVINVHGGDHSDIYATSSIQLGRDDNSCSIIKMSTYDENDSNVSYEHSLTISAFDGVKVDGSKVLTETVLGEHNMLVAVDENGIANKSEITIGSFEIKNDKPYNYTLESLYEDDAGIDIVIEASYDGEPSQLVEIYPYSWSQGFEKAWCYKFIVTSEHGEKIPNYVYIPSALIDGDYTSEYYSLLNFTEDVSETFSIYIAGDGARSLSNAKITRSTPFSLKHTSKALLNGSPIVTTNMIQEFINKINALESRIEALEGSSQ